MDGTLGKIAENNLAIVCITIVFVLGIVGSSLVSVYAPVEEAKEPRARTPLDRCFDRGPQVMNSDFCMEIAKSYAKSLAVVAEPEVDGDALAFPEE